MKIKKLEQLVKRLERMLDTPEELGRFNMNHFGLPFRPTYLVGEDQQTSPPICNTSACLAGETVLEFKTGFISPEGGISIGGKQGWSANTKILAQATKDLGLTSAQVNRLFFFKNWVNVLTNMSISTGWPSYFQKRYADANTQQGALLVTIRRLEFFIKTNGTDKGADKLS